MKKRHCIHSNNELVSPELKRREFLQLAALSAGVSLFTVIPFAPESHAADGKARTLLLTCMDYRLMDEIERYMLRRGLYHNYDHIVLAGASLGAVTEKYPAWTRTFWDHLDLSVKLHGIHTVMVIDHRDCGAYRELLGEDYSDDPEKETVAHTAKLMQLKGMIKNQYPDIEVETLLMDLKGEIEVIHDPSEKQEKLDATTTKE